MHYLRCVHLAGRSCDAWKRMEVRTSGNLGAQARRGSGEDGMEEYVGGAIKLEKLIRGELYYCFPSLFFFYLYIAIFLASNNKI